MKIYFSSRFLKDLEEQVMDNDSVVWKGETEWNMDANTNVAPISPSIMNDLRY